MQLPEGTYTPIEPADLRPTLEPHEVVPFLPWRRDEQSPAREPRRPVHDAATATIKAGESIASTGTEIRIAVEWIAIAIIAHGVLSFAGRVLLFFKGNADARRTGESDRGGLDHGDDGGSDDAPADRFRVHDRP